MKGATMPEDEENQEPPFNEDTPPKSESELLNERLTSIETALSELSAKLQTIETDYTRGDHTHDGYSPSEHEHGYAPNEHTHEQAFTSQENNEHSPESRNIWFKRIGS